MSKPRVLFYDIETRPIEAYVWGLYDQNIGLNQIVKDQGLMSWSAKWLGSKEIMYQDLRGAKDVYNDKNLLKGIWELLDSADVVVTQNGKAFDQKKLYMHFRKNGYKKPSPSLHIDTKILAKRHFGFTSNSLAFLCQVLETKHQKLDHKRFPGMDLWVECLKGNKLAWQDMQLYNKNDVFCLEEVWEKLAPWDQTVNFSVFGDPTKPICTCGSAEFERRGFKYTSAGKYQRYQCKKCGAWTRGATNLFNKDEKARLHRSIPNA